MQSSEDFRALVLDEAGGKVSSSLKTLPDDVLPAGDVVVRIAYSDLNYKDGMVVKGIGRLVKTYPHVPGIDFSGVVESSESPKFRPGDKVILTGWRVGEIHWGGYAGKARVKSEWLVPLPEGMTLRPGDGRGHGGVHRHARGHESRGAWAPAGEQGRCAHHRCQRRRGQRRGRVARQPRISRRGGDRPTGYSRLSEGARRGHHRRSCRTGALQGAARPGTLVGCDRQR